MRNSFPLQAILVVSGLIGVVIGLATLLTPEAFHATAGIDLGGSTSLLSEIRAPGGALLSLGALVMAGAFIERVRYTATVVSCAVYLSYGVARVLSIAVDGMPANILVAAMAGELFIGLACAAAFVFHRR